MSEEKSSASCPVAPVKKKPGRPRKKPIKEPIERKGVAQSPYCVENAIELIYDEPVVYRRALAIFNSAHANTITFMFEADHIKIIGTDHVGKADILVQIDCTRVPHYYCSERLVAPINAKVLDRVNQTIDKNCTMINIIIKKDATEPSILMVLENELIKMRENQTVSILPEADYQFKPEYFEYVNHTLNFELPNKSFKKLISNAALILGRLSGRLTIQKVGASGPLTFMYATADKNINTQCTADDAGVIKLQSNIDEDDIFITSIQLDYLKPYANLLCETVRIYADTSKRLVLSGQFDNETIHMKVAITVITSIPERLG